MLEIVEDFIAGFEASSLGFGSPMSPGPHTCGTDQAVAEANYAAQRVIESEFGDKKEAAKWYEMMRDDATVKITSLYLKSSDNFRATAWIGRKV